MTSTILVQHVLIWIHELRAQSAAIYDQLVQLACVITQSQKVWKWMAKQQSMNIKCWILKHGLVRIGVAKIYMSFWRDIVWNAWWRCLRSIAAAILHGVLQLISREAVLWRISSVVSQVWCELINCHGGEYGGGRGEFLQALQWRVKPLMARQVWRVSEAEEASIRQIFSIGWWPMFSRQGNAFRPAFNMCNRQGNAGAYR